MSETSKSKKAESPSPAKSSDSATTASPDSTTSSPSNSGGGGKSSRESVGGSGAVHYGYFSNIKSPEYKSGWDDIWGGKKSKPRKVASSKKTVRKTVKKKEPVVLSLNMADLPEQLQKDLASIARDKLKKSRISYDTRDKAGAVSWRIECEVKR